MRRSVVLAVVLALGLGLVGCAVAGGPATRPQSGAGWKFYGLQGGGVATGGDGSAGAPTGAADDYDAALPAGVTLEWADPLAADPDFTVSRPDDGEGAWSYTQVSSGCTLSFQQAAADDLVTVGDERTSSDAALARFLGWSPDAVADAQDVRVPLTGGSRSTFAARAETGTDSDGSDWIALARVFADPSIALALDVTCPAGVDAAAQLTTLFPGRVAALQH